MARTPIIDRRKFLEGVGALAVTGALAGCAGGDGGDGGGGGGGGAESPTPTSTPTSTRTPTQTPTQTPTGGDGGGAPSNVEDWLSDASNYDGVVDQTGTDQVTVAVGAEGNGGNFAFEPAAVRVSSGTTVVWEWTGEGGTHNVISGDDSDFSFDSGDPVAEAGTTFEHTFEGTGTALYYCEPHRGLGMKGAVVVE